ncbi:MAG: ABC transporter permease [Pseudolabrys sp.]|nr:ABC transporter permease [Pseudolabrys sp.]MBV9260745.1 ABC transporter permease [Pseudolabrys sp.]
MQDFHQALSVAFQLIGSRDPELSDIVALSLRVSMTATVIATLVGAPLGVLLAITRFPGRQSLIVLVNALLGLPPVVVGLAVYLLLSRSGVFGDLGWLYTPAAMVVAQVTLTTPIVLALVHRMTEGLWRDYGDHLQIDGASRPRAIYELLVIGRAGLLTAFLFAFGRAISEVGAIIVVGGNIRGVTRTMTTAIALETTKGELALALGLGVILITISIGVSAAGFLLNRLTSRD